MKKWISMIMVMAAVLWTAAGCAKTDAQKIAEQLELGQKYLLEYNYEEAVVAFQNVLEIEPKQMEAYLGLAKAYRKLDEDEQELDVLEEARQVIEDSYDEEDSLFTAADEVLERLADLYVRCGEADKASEIAELADSMDIDIQYEDRQNADGSGEASEETSSSDDRAGSGGDEDGSSSNAAGDGGNDDGSGSDNENGNDGSGGSGDDAEGNGEEDNIANLRRDVESQYGIVSSDAFTSCEGSSISEFPSYVYGILAEQDIDLTRDGEKYLLILRTEQAGSSSDPCILAEVYGNRDGNTELIASSQIGRIEYCQASFIYLYYDEPAGQYRIVIDYASSGAYTNVNEYGITIFSIHDGAIERYDGWVGGSPLSDFSSDIGTFLESAGVPYAKYSTQTDNRAACAYYRPLCEIEHELYSTAPDGDMASYISRGHKLRLSGNYMNGDNWTPSENRDDETEAAAGSDADRLGYKEAYAQVLRDIAAEWTSLGPNGPHFDAADIDGDGIPELLVSVAESHICAVDIYQYIGGEAVLIGSSGEFGEIQYLPGENYIYSEFFVNGVGGGLYIQRIENGEIVDDIFYSPTRSADLYEKNGESISKEQYETEAAQLRKPGLVTFSYRSGYEITEENIQARLGLDG